MLARITILAVLALCLGCGDKTSDDCDGGACNTNGDTTQSSNANNDPTCQTPCPAGEVQEFGQCDDPSCVTRMACGEEVTCRNQVSCLAVSSCADGGLLLDACPPDEPTCLPYMICGVQKYCITLQQCARDACDAGESATTLGCDDPAISQPCREVTACGADSVTCVCRAEDLFCDEEETFDTAPCTPGQMCREVVGCGTTFYCKGGSI